MSIEIPVTKPGMQQRMRFEVPEVSAEEAFRVLGPAGAFLGLGAARFLADMPLGDAWLYLFYGLLAAFPVSTAVELVTQSLADRRPHDTGA
jgi:hypothetical protein